MRNGGFRGNRAGDNLGLRDEVSVFTETDLTIPKINYFAITDNSYNDLGVRALSISGGEYVLLNGSGFTPGLTARLGSNIIGSITYLSSTQVAFVAPALSVGIYTLIIHNNFGGAAIYVPGIQYSQGVAFAGVSGELGITYETVNLNTSLGSSSDSTITYTLLSGALPAGASINQSNGSITGIAPVTSSNQLYTFTIKATDAEGQYSIRTFNLTVNTDVVTWTTPADNSTTALSNDVASSTTLLATSAAGKAITYTANALPTGLSIVGDAVTGTPTVTASTTSTFTATAATTGRTATRTINWTVSVAGETYFPYTTLLLSGATATETFITDASTNNFVVTIAGDTKPNNFNPYTPGYYSNYFDGSGDYLTVANGVALQLSTTDFTIEFWWNGSASGSFTQNIGTLVSSNEAGTYRVGTRYNSTNYVYFARGTGAGFDEITYNVNVNDGAWHHIACVRTSGVITMYVDGIARTAATGSTAISATCTTSNPLVIGYNGRDVVYSTGYTSNARIVKGTAVYTANFTPSTTPLTAIANTSLLTCQSNRFIDNSSNAFAVTAVDNTKISSATPFVPNTAYAAYGSTYFDGSNNWLTLLTNPNIPYAYKSGNFCLECWHYMPSAYSGVDYLVSYWNSAPYKVIILGFGYGATDGKVSFAWTTDGSTDKYISSPAALAINQWHHIAAMRTGNTISLFVDGVRVATVSETGTLNSTGLAGNNTIMAHNAGVGDKSTGYLYGLRSVIGNNPYDATSATLTVPTAPLTAVTGTSLLTLQTNQPVNNSMFLDSSTNAFLVTRAGNTSAGTFSPYGANWSNYFDGSDGLVPAAGLSAAMGTGFAGNIISFELWIYPTSFTNGGDGNGIMGAYAAVAANGRWLVSMERSATTTAKLEMAYTTGTGSQNNIASTASAILLNQWNHIAVTVDATTAASSTIKLFANGVLLNTFTGQNMSTHTTYYRQVYIGDVQSQYVSPMIGYISNFRILKGAFAYTANYTVPTAPLTATANTVFLTCQSNGLVDNSINAFAISKSGDTSVQRFSPFSPQTQTAITHSAYFDGTGDYLTAPASQGAAWNFTGDFTFECWIYPNPLTGYHTLLGQWGSGDNTLIWKFNGSGRMYFENLNGAAITATSTTIVANQWQHIALTRSSNTIRMFVNGVQDATTATRSQTYNSSGPMLVGASGVAEAVNGYISNMRIVKGVAVYTVTFTPPTAPLTATQAAGTNIAAVTGTQTSLLTCQSPTFVDNSSNNFALTAFDNVKPRTINPFGFTSATAAYSAATYGGSAYYGIKTDYISVPATTALTTFIGNFTFECWVYPITGAPSTNWGIWDSRNSAQTAAAMVFTLQTGPATGQWYPSYYYGSGTQTYGTGIVYADRWTHVAFVRSGSTLTYYVNGVAGNAVNIGAGTHAGNAGAGTPIYIGTKDSGLNGYGTLGYISNFRIVNGTAVYTSNFVPPTTPLTAITNTSLLLNMNSAGIYDSASMNDLETVADAKRVSTHTPYAGSYYSNYFDGTGDYLSIPASSAQFSPGANNLTVEGWFYFTNLSAGVQNLFGSNNGSGTTQKLMAYVEANGTIHFDITQAGGVSQATSAASTVTNNVWYHLAFVRSAGTAYIYVNGFSVASGAATGNLSALANPFYIGYIGEGYGVLISGYISNFRYVNGTAVYTANFTPSTTPLTAIANTRLLTCQSNRFVDNSTNAFTITRYDGASVQSFNPFQRNSGTSLYFDGTGDYLKAPYTPGLIFGTGDFTIECWLYQVAFVSDMVITASYASWASSVNFYLGTRAGSPNILIFRAGDSIPITLNGNTAILANSWTHVAVSRASGVTRMFVDGVAQSATHTGSINIGATVQSTGIGAANNASEPINGYINDLRITKGIARYPSGTTFVPSTTAFTAR